jgi:deoxyribonuclease IV
MFTMPTLRFGAHMPTSGGLEKAVLSAATAQMDCVQLFTSSPRQWASKPLEPKAIRQFRRAVESTTVYPIIVHDSYLINLASPDAETREKSRRAFLAEMQRCEQLGVDYLVSHPGAHMNAGVESGITTLADSLNWLHEQTPNYRLRVALETTAAKGTTLGGVLEHFPAIFNQVTDSKRLCVCVDTCHLFDAGYDIREATTFWDSFDSIIGLSNLAIVHANDSKFGLGSKRDHHEHIGAGTIGDDAFRAFLTDSRLPNNLPIIVETPDAENYHPVNVWKLRQLTK